MESKAVEVLCYSGYVADEEPRAIVLDGRRLGITAVERRWREPDARLFAVRLADQTTCILRQDVVSGVWMMRP